MDIPYRTFLNGDYWTRRRFLRQCLLTFALASSHMGAGCERKRLKAPVFIARAESYETDMAAIMLRAFRELGVMPEEIRGKRILLKPNLVETWEKSVHINTHPLVVRGAIEAFLTLGASEVLVGEGPGHRRDMYLVLEESGLGRVLIEDRIRFVDLNHDDIYTVPNPNPGVSPGLKTLSFPHTLRKVDWVVSMPKLKTHHWVGVTLSMKNLFGVMPGIVYGWPKNVFHIAGIEQSIVDINAALRPNMAIVDGIVGMEGDGPIMGNPKSVGVIVMGRNLPAVDGTCARIMGIDPGKVPYLRNADPWLGPIKDDSIKQLGESIRSVKTNFLLLDHIPSQRGIRLSS